MSARDGGPAFPIYPRTQGMRSSELQDAIGMSLRDYFAAKAMCIKFGPRGTSMELPKIAAACYAMADAMLAAREAQP